MKARQSVADVLSAVKRNRGVYGGLVALLWLTSCTRPIDFEHDVPQRAKAISQQEVAAVRRTMKTEKSQEQYRDYMKEARVKGRTEGSLRRDLARLEQELRRIEADVAGVKGGTRRDLQRQIKQLKAEIRSLRTRLSYIESGRAHLKAHPPKVSKGKAIPRKAATRKRKQKRSPQNRPAAQTKTPQVQETAPVEDAGGQQVVSDYPNNVAQPGVIMPQPGVLQQAPQILVQPQQMLPQQQMMPQQQILQQPVLPQQVLPQPNVQQMNPGLLTTVPVR